MHLTNLVLFSSSAAALAAKVQTGCGKALPSGQQPGQLFQVPIPTAQDSGRVALVSLPPKYDINTKTQAILSFHGGDRTAMDQVLLDGLTNTTVNSDKIVVYPQADGKYWQGTPDIDSDDVGFTNTILDYIQQNYCVDTTRIFATGKSEGGGFCGVLACDNALSKRIAAFAPVSGAFYISGAEFCDPDTVTIPCSAGRVKIPFLEFHGGNDTTIAYGGDDDRKGGCLPSIPHYIRDWARRDGLSVKNTTSVVSTDTVLYTYGSGADTGLVQQVFDATIGHDWPSTSTNDDNKRTGHKKATFNATPMILDFFAKHSL